MLSRLIPEIELTLWPLITLVAFLFAFIVLLIDTFAAKNRALFQQRALIPLTKDDK